MSAIWRPSLQIISGLVFPDRVCLQCGRPEFNPWDGKFPWGRKWQPTPVFLPGEFHGQRSLVGCSPWGHKESDRTEWLTLSLSLSISNLKSIFNLIHNLRYAEDTTLMAESEEELKSLLMKVKEKLLVSQSHWALCNQPTRLLCPWNSPGKKTGVGCNSHLQVIFTTQGSIPGLLHYKQILYHLSHQEAEGLHS